MLHSAVNWLRDNAFLATWLASPVSLLGWFLQAKQTHFTQMNWFRLIIYFTFLTGLGVAFTPTFDQAARTFGKYLVTVLLGVIIVTRHE